MLQEISPILFPSDYRLLFESSDEGVAILEKADMQPGGRIDFRLILVNPAFENTRLTGVTCKTVLTVLPGITGAAMRTFNGILVSRQPARFETYESALDQWFSAYTFPIGAPEQRRIAIVFRDISQAKNAETLLQESVNLQAYKLRLSDALRPLADPLGIQYEAARILGEHLGLSHVGYGEVEEDGYISFQRNYTAVGFPAYTGHFQISVYGPDFLAVLLKGGAVAIPDVANAAEFAPAVRDSHIKIGIAALAGVPIVKSGRLVAVLTICSPIPRVWTPLELALLMETAERTWEAVARARAEEALKESEIKYHNLFNSIDEGFCIVELLFGDHGQPADYRYLEVNPAFQRQTGLSNAAGRRMRELVPGHEQFWFDTYGRIAMTGEPARFQGRAEALGFFYDVYAFRVGEPAQRRVAVLFNDITERRRAVDALEESEGRLRALTLASTNVVYRMGPDWSSMTELFGNGFLADTREPNQSWMDKYIHPDDREFVAGVIAECIREKKMFNLEHRVRKADGSIGWTHSRAVPLPDGEGGIKEWIGMAYDITERRNAEETLRESENRARALVRQLEEADANKDRFLSVLSHELRNPLAAITVGLSILQSPEQREQAASVMEIMHRQVGQLCKLVDDLLDLTRITHNRITLKKEPVLLGEILRGAAEDIQPAFAQKNVELSLDIPPQPFSLNADPVRIAQCAGNLLHNALKYTPAQGSVWMSLHEENGEAVITVRDSGVGISPQMLSVLFEPFTQADDSLARPESNGLGLGLSIVRGIAELHGGSVSASSEGPEKGAVFTFRLPLSKAEPGQPRTAVTMEPRRGLRVLVIEDSGDQAELYCTMIRMLGHIPAVARDGAQGLKKAKEIKPDVILCDIGLPEKSGYEVARAIREEEGLKDVLLIALTGYAGGRDIRQAEESGFDRHLAKPLQGKELQKILSEGRPAHGKADPGTDR